MPGPLSLMLITTQSRYRCRWSVICLAARVLRVMHPGASAPVGGCPRMACAAFRTMLSTVFAEFNNLPQFVRDECINVFNIELGPDSSILNSNISTYKNDIVFNILTEQGILEQTDIVIKLQDLIKTNGTVLFDQLGIEGNDRCCNFVKHWLSLHTEEQLTYLLT